MTAIRDGELTRMQAVQYHHMMDSCRILAYSTADDAYNIPQDSHTAGSEIRCGFDPSGWKEAQEESEVPIMQPTFRLPFGTAVNSRDRIRLTKRFGEAITPEDYEIIGGVERGPSGLVANTKLVTDGSS